ncbi:MAG: histidinol-phosphate aminotransferase [Sulfurimonas sp.]|jgi:histidinol-phosphate aminotransferase
MNTYETAKPIELVVREFGIESKDIMKLASNENPYGCSPKVQKSIVNIISCMALYPDDSMIKLKIALSNRFEIEVENIIIGSGSDQVIEFIMHSKANANSKILINSVTFAMYEIYAKHVGAEVIKTTSIEHNLEEFYTLYQDQNPDIIFLCTPNNPTGDALGSMELFSFLDKIDSDTLVVIDGAYMEYAQAKDNSKKVDPKLIVSKYENVIYLGTFSKAYGLGGMRVGYGVANENIIKELYKLRPPFNITTLSLEAASVALEDEEFVHKTSSLNFQEMDRYEDFALKQKINITNSYTNFVTFHLNQNQNSSKISYQLLSKGIIVRDLHSYDMNAIRVTVGTNKQNSKFFLAFKKLL